MSSIANMCCVNSKCPLASYLRWTFCKTYFILAWIRYSIFVTTVLNSFNGNLGDIVLTTLPCQGQSNFMFMLKRNIHHNVAHVIQRTCFPGYFTRSDLNIFVAVYITSDKYTMLSFIRWIELSRLFADSFVLRKRQLHGIQWNTSKVKWN